MLCYDSHNDLRRIHTSPACGEAATAHGFPTVAGAAGAFTLRPAGIAGPLRRIRPSTSEKSI